jgi:hypothetical protein
MEESHFTGHAAQLAALELGVDSSAKYEGTTVVVPTRNRAILASNAISSIVAHRRVDVQILVSDNSTDPEERKVLAAFCERLGEDNVHYVRPPAPMPVAAHWEWALQRVLGLDYGTHVLYLTDRNIFKPGCLDELLTLAQRFPAKLLTYNVDGVDDSTRPVRLVQCEWSGKLLEVKSSHILYLCSRLVQCPSLPQPCFSVFPLSVATAIQARFGNVFGSLAPDLSFAFRCLEVVDSILYYDKAMLLEYRSDLSTSGGVARGVPTPGSADLAAEFGGGLLRLAVPLPSLNLLANYFVHEYNVVRAESKSGKFPEIDRPGYLAVCARDVSRLQDPHLASEAKRLLEEIGWRSSSRGRRLLDRLQSAIRHPYKVVDRLISPVLAGARTKRFWMLLARRGLHPPASRWFHFHSTEEAITYAGQFPRRRRRNPGHLYHLRGSRLLDAARRPPAAELAEPGSSRLPADRS